MQLLQNGKQQFIDQNGLPLANGTVGFYAPGTLNPQATYQDQAGTIQNTNPITLDSRGQAIIWGTGTYRQIVKDASGVTIWDQVVDTPAGAASLSNTTGAGGTALIGFDNGTLAQFFLSKNNRVVDSIAALRALSKATYTRAFVTGYYAAGDGGGGAYWYDPSDTTSADNGGTIIVASDGGRWKLENVANGLSVRQFGAKGDGVTDDTAAIQAAINACYGRNLYLPLPVNFYYVNNASGLSITNQIRLVGEIGTFIKYGPNIASTTDVISWSAATTVEGLEIENLWIVEASGTPARDVLRVNLSSTSGLKKLRISRCMFRSKNGYAVNINNPSGAGVNTNGLFVSVIEKSELNGGITGTNLGDSVTICDNVITGPNAGISLGMLPSTNPTGPSACLAIERNNITAQGGAISVNPGRNLRIVGNNIEQTAALPGGYCISLANIDYGSVNGASLIENNKVEAADGVAQCGAMSMFQCNGTAVKNNNMGGSSKPSSFTYTIALTACVQVKILDNTLYASTNGVAVGVTDSGSSYTAIFGNTYKLASGATSISDSGTGTKGVWRALSYNTGWSRYLAGDTNLSVFKDRNSMVYLRGRVQKSTAIVANDLIATLPSGFLPEDGGNGGNLRLSGTFSNSSTGTSTTAAIRVLSASSGSPGQILVADALTNPQAVSLDGLSFYSPDV